MILQLRELGQLIGLSGNLCSSPDIVLECRFLFVQLCRLPLAHGTTAGDHIAKDAEQRKQNHKDEPACLAPSAQVRAAKDVDDNLGYQENPQHPEKEPQHREEY